MSKIIASVLDIPSPVLQRVIKIIVKVKHKGISISLVSFWNFTGLITVDNPKINNRLHTLLPITFPIAISERPCIADVTLTNSSGIDVPIETIVNPIKISGIWNFFAILLEPSTRKSAPFISSINPIIIKITGKTIISIPLSYC